MKVPQQTHAFLMLGALLLTQCPGQGNKTRAKACSQAYEQCQLPEGPLGVCQEVSCRPGQAPPCLACVSQH